MARGAGLDVVVSKQQADPPGSRLPVIEDWLRSKVFLSTARPAMPDPAPRWVTLGKVVLAVLAVIAGAAISLARTTGPGALNSIWIEDARDLLSQAYLYPFGHLLTVPLAGGYWEDTGRVATQIAKQFPTTWAPGVMSAIAALFYAVSGLIAYVASGPHLRNPILQLLIAAPCVMIPLGYTQANNDLATMQFVMLYGTFWVLLWIPSTLGGKIAASLFMLSIAANTMGDYLYAPLVVARLIADRSKATLSLAGIWLAGVCIQGYSTFFSPNSRQPGQHNSPFWIAWQYASEAVPRALFGEKALGGPGAEFNYGLKLPDYQITPAVHLGLALAAWAVVLVALILARVRLTNPNWPLVVVALLSSLLALEGSLIFNLHLFQPRYVICPALLLYAALVAALRPRGVAEPGPAGAAGPDRSPASRWAARALAWLPVACLTAVVAVAITANFQVDNGRSNTRPWTAIVATAKTECALHGVNLPRKEWRADPWQGGAYVYEYLWYTSVIPCNRVLAQRSRRRARSFSRAGDTCFRSQRRPEDDGVDALADREHDCDAGP